MNELNELVRRPPDAIHANAEMQIISQSGPGTVAHDRLADPLSGAETFGFSPLASHDGLCSSLIKVGRIVYFQIRSQRTPGGKTKNTVVLQACFKYLRGRLLAVQPYSSVSIAATAANLNLS